MRRVITVVALTVVAACGGSSPAAPDLPPPPASLNATGPMTFSLCNETSGCLFEGEAANSGAGCAINVRGLSRLLNQGGAEIARAEWSLVSTRRINPGEKFLYSGCCFSLAAANTPGSYHTAITWDNVRC